MKMHTVSQLLFLLLLVYHSRWTYGRCHFVGKYQMNSTVATCLDNITDIITYIRDENETWNTLEGMVDSLKGPYLFENLTAGSLPNWSNLKHLDLSGGNVKSIEEGSFRNFSNLKSLNLRNNKIEYLGLASLEGLVHLHSLNLRKNAIRQLPPALARLKRLKFLDIRDNPLECNCATLKVRDLITQRGVTLSKKFLCAAPSTAKGTFLSKLNTTIVCIFEQQDREMQNDQAEGSGMYLESEDLEEFYDSEKFVEPEVETPVPTALENFTTKYSTTESSTVTSEQITSTAKNSTTTKDEEEIFFAVEEKKEQLSTTEMSNQKVIKDGLYYPVSGDEEASGEGSGDDEEHDKTINSTSSTTEGTIFGLLFDFFGGDTMNPDNEEEPDESTELSTDESFVPSHNYFDNDETTEPTAMTPTLTTNSVEVIKSVGIDKGSKSDNVKVDENRVDGAEVSEPTKESKKGMGSYIVLAALLVVLVALIAFAAYKGDFCRKKRKRGEVESGTEMKDMQKSLLPDVGNATQTKIASNGNTENVPLMDGTPNIENAKVEKVGNDYQTQNAPRSVNGTADHSDPVKPPRKLIGPHDEQKIEERPRVDVNFLKKNFLEDRPSLEQSPSPVANNGPMTHASDVPDGPPLSPGAQRVKITLQEIPDSVPKTPILITRTMAGENLVKTP